MSGFVQSGGTTSYGTGQTVTLTGVAAGNTILVWVTSQGGTSSVSDGTAYTKIGTVSSSGQQLDVYKLTSVSAGTHAIVATFGSSNGLNIVAAEYNNADVTGTPQFTDSAFPGTGANIVVSGSTTPAVANATLSMFVEAVSGTPGFSAGTTPIAFTGGRTSATNCYLEDAVLVGGSGTAVSGTAGNSVNCDNLIALVALAPIVVGPPSQAEVVVASGSTATVAITALANDDVLVGVAWNPGGGTILSGGVAEGGINYVQVGSTVVSGANKNIALFLLTGAGAGVHNPVFTVTGGNTSIYLFGKAVTGYTTTDGTAGNDIATSGTGANVLTSGSFTTTQAADRIYSFFAQCSGTATTPTAGTSPNTFTSDALATAGYLLEHFTQGSAGAINPTAGTVNSGEFTGISVALVPAAAPSTALMGQIML